MYLSNIECINSILVGAKLKINILTANTFPANRRSPPCCRLDTSLLSAAQQGAERRSASKVMGQTRMTNSQFILPMVVVATVGCIG